MKIQNQIKRTLLETDVIENIRNPPQRTRCREKIAKLLLMPELLSDKDKKSKQKQNTPENIEYYESVIESVCRGQAACLSSFCSLFDSDGCLHLGWRYVPMEFGEETLSRCGLYFGHHSRRGLSQVCNHSVRREG